MVAAAALFPCEYVVGEVLQCFAEILFEQRAAERREVGLQPVVAAAVEHQAVEGRITRGNLFHQRKYVLLILRVGRINHAAVFVLLPGDGYDAVARVVDHACPLGMLAVNQARIEIVVTGAKHVD